LLDTWLLTNLLNQYFCLQIISSRRISLYSSIAKNAKSLERILENIREREAERYFAFPDPPFVADRCPALNLLLTTSTTTATTTQGETFLSFETAEHSKNLLRRLTEKLKRELGPFIVKALENEDVLEICVNSDGRVWLEEHGKRLYDTGEKVASESLLAALGTIAAMCGMELNKANPVLEGCFPLDGSRVEGSIPPVSPGGPSMTIRKHTSTVIPLSRYVSEKRIPPEAAEYLRTAIRDAQNILVAGGTSSGKTTFVNALILELLTIAPQDRLVVIEDTMELQCATANKQNFVAAETVSMRNLLKMAMRYRPDRIIIGEVRGGEALDLLKSWNTGHPGGFATVHANNARASLLRLEQLIAEVSVTPMQTLIAEAVNVVIYMKEFGRLGRQVTEIIRVTGFKEGEYRYEPIYELKAGRKNQ
jgi:type IV secretion system protein VirB11